MIDARVAHRAVSFRHVDQLCPPCMAKGLDVSDTAVSAAEMGRREVERGTLVRVTLGADVSGLAGPERSRAALGSGS